IPAPIDVCGLLRFPQGKWGRFGLVISSIEAKPKISSMKTLIVAAIREMRDVFGNRRIVHNRLSSQLLYRLLDFRHWNELTLAILSGILPSVVSAQLCGKVPIRPQHLAAYLRLLDRQERASLLHAWLRDTVGRDVIAQLLDGTKTNSMPSVEENQCRMLDWWATAIARDSKVAKIFTR